MPPPPPKQPAPSPGNQQGTAQRNEPNPQAPPQSTAANSADGTQPGGAGTPGAGDQTSQNVGNEPGSARGLDNTETTDGPVPAGTGTSNHNAGAADTRVNTRTDEQRPLNLSETQARQLLDALQAAERQYWQQIPHRGTKRPDPGKPRW